MKINELKRIAEENDYELKEEKEVEQITLERKVTFDGFVSNVITINSIMKNLIFIESKHCDDKDIKMIKASVKFAETPIDEREEEKKFYLKHRWLRCLGGCALLHESTKFHTFVLMGGFGEVPKDYKMKFTQKEIDGIKEKFNADLSDFEMIEVKE